MMNPEESLGRWISIIYRYGQSHIGKQLESHGIGSGQFVFLIELFRRDGISQDELTAILRFDKGTTARALQKLEKEGFIFRERSEEDRRINRVFLTEKAREFQPILFGVLSEWTDALAEGFSQEERGLTLEILKRLAGNAARFIDEKRG